MAPSPASFSRSFLPESSAMRTRRATDAETKQIYTGLARRRQQRGIRLE
jgi:hypothetical protein